MKRKNEDNALASAELQIERGTLIPCKVLVVEGNRSALNARERMMHGIVSGVITAQSGEEALRRATDDVAVAIVSLNLPKTSGLELLKELLQRHPNINVIIVSDRGGVSAAIAATRLGAFWYLDAPLDRDELAALVDRAFAFYQLRRDNQELRLASSSAYQSSLVGDSSLIRDLLAKAVRLAELESTVLLSGETGTGKSTLARLIHQQSPRRDKPFVMLNCSAVPQELIEAELFGYEKGSFTGAYSSRIGSLEQANGGTIFLDEIGDLPLGLQPKLLTFLQDHVVRRIGGNRDILIDVRVITATNRQLNEMVAQLRFREDLFYRINVLNLTIPPLRSRKEDIPALAKHILARIACRRGSRGWALSEEAMRALMEYDWPGNVRELENILERATAFSPRSVITAADIDIPVPPRPKATPPADTSVICIDGLPLDQIEEQVFRTMLAKCDGNRTHLARALGISSKTVYNKLLKYGLS